VDFGGAKRRGGSGIEDYHLSPLDIGQAGKDRRQGKRSRGDQHVPVQFRFEVG